MYTAPSGTVLSTISSRSGSGSSNSSGGGGCGSHLTLSLRCSDEPSSLPLRSPKDRTPPHSPKLKSPKRVKFSSDLEDVVLFNRSETPCKVSGEELPVTWELTASHPSAAASAPVALESLILTPCSSYLLGRIRVANLAFNKLVACRFSLDNWETVSETTAAWSHSISSTTDIFEFKIRIAEELNLENKRLQFCLRFTCGGREYWDNNNGRNYEANFKRKVPVRKGKGEKPVKGILIPSPPPSPTLEPVKLASPPKQRERKAASPPPLPRPTALMLPKPLFEEGQDVFGSQLYREIIEKYCFAANGSPKPHSEKRNDLPTRSTLVSSIHRPSGPMGMDWPIAPGLVC